jgi:hypothetical protein
VLLLEFGLDLEFLVEVLDALVHDFAELRHYLFEARLHLWEQFVLDDGCELEFEGRAVGFAQGLLVELLG